jgi:hypothetical protein
MDRLTVAAHDQKISLWINRIRECKASKQTVSEWCEDNGVGIKTYYYWMRKIKREAFDAIPAERKPKGFSNTPSQTAFAEIPKCRTAKSSSTAVIIRVGNTTLEIQNGADANTVENTLRIIKCLC